MANGRGTVTKNSADGGDPGTDVNSDRGRIAVTGATGALGSRVAIRLAARGVRTALLARDPSRLPLLQGAEHRGPAPYGDARAMRAALRDVESLLLVSGGLSGRRFEEHTTVIDAAKACGVSRIIYISLIGAAEHATFLHARDHWQTEQYLASVAVRWTVLRPSIYTRMLAARADNHGIIRGPGGAGKFAPVDHDDIADVVANLLATKSVGPEVNSAALYQVDSTILEVTGPAEITLQDAAKHLTNVTGRLYSYESETVDEAISRGLQTNDRDEVARWVSWYQAIAKEEFRSITDVVPRITGHAAKTLAESLAHSLAEQ